MKFKHGDRVTCKIEGCEITDARISINKYGDPFICQNKKDGNKAEEMLPITSHRLGYRYSWALRKDFTSSFVKDLKLKIKDISDISTYEVGDVLLDSNGDARTVLGICGRVAFVSAPKNPTFYAYGYTAEQMAGAGYSFKDTPLKTTLTKAQIAEKLGLKEDELEIKD